MTEYLGNAVAITTTPPPPTGGGPQLPLGEFAAYNDPSVPSSYSASRTSGKAVVYGHFFPPGTTSSTNPYGGSAVTWDNGAEGDNTEVHGHSVDGETLRFGVRSSPELPSGKSMLIRTHWSSAAQSTYSYQSTPKNTTVNPPDADYLYYDGNRFQFDYSENGLFLKSGPNADTVTWLICCKFDDWIYANDNKTVGPSMHPPNGVPSAGPAYMNWVNGQLRIGKSSGWLYESGGTWYRNDYPNSQDAFLASASSDWANKWQAFIIQGKFSYETSDSPFLKVWHRMEDTAWQQTGEISGVPVGYTFYTDASRSNYDSIGELNFTKNSQYYQWHAWGNNWDTTYPLREYRYGFCGWFKNTSRTISEMQDHLDYYMPAA